MKGWIFWRKVASLFSSETSPPLEMESNYFLFNLSLIFISCDERTVITHKNVLMTGKWFRDWSFHISHSPWSTYRWPAWEASWCKWGAGLKGLAYGGYPSNKKHRNKRPQLEAPLDAGRNKGSYCEIFEHFLMYFKLLNSPIIFHIPVFNEEHHS